MFKGICFQCMQTALADEHGEIDIQHISTVSFNKHVYAGEDWSLRLRWWMHFLV
jgi:hypothetical protein